MTSDSNAMLIQSASCDQNITAETKNNAKINDYRDVKDKVWNLQNQAQPQMILEKIFFTNYVLNSVCESDEW